MKKIYTYTSGGAYITLQNIHPWSNFSPPFRQHTKYYTHDETVLLNSVSTIFNCKYQLVTQFPAPHNDTNDGPDLEYAQEGNESENSYNS